MDLSTTFPRSVKERLAGVVMLARTTDKARAKLTNTLGEYHYNCPMDQAVFGFLGIDHEQYLEKVRTLNEAALQRWVRDEFTSKKTPVEIENWNAEYVQSGPAKGSESETYFLDLRNSLDPTRTDITAWADLLDLDEKRPVARKETVGAPST